MNKSRKLISTLIITILSISIGESQSLNVKWKFKTEDRVIASPVEKNGIVYIGGQDGVFYAIDLERGKELWKFDTEGIIKAKALLIDNAIFFESANVFYLLDQQTGKEIWRFDTKMKPLSFKYEGKEYFYKIDPFDDKRSKPTVYKGVIYVGSGNGTLYGFDPASGKVIFSVTSDESSPIRSSPYVKNDRLFFGDWNGLVYCYDLTNSELLWKKKTYRGEKPYSTFGGVVSEFLTYDGMLFFGARNYMMNVLLEENGEKEWTFTDPIRGWMIGDPVIYKDTLYVGGSDNFSMYAFHPNIGQPLWSQNGGKNIYTKPIVTDKWVIYTSGNGYNSQDTGLLYMLNRKNGEVITTFETPKGIFSSPILVDDHILFGSYDGYIYALAIRE